jgi:hypothetical protein
MVMSFCDSEKVTNDCSVHPVTVAMPNGVFIGDKATAVSGIIEVCRPIKSRQ